MLGKVDHRSQFLAAHGQEQALWRGPDLAQSGGQAGHLAPTVAGAWHPRRAAQGQQGATGQGRRRNRVFRHSRGEGMGGVDHQIDSLGGQMGGQAGRPAETAQPHRYRLGHRRLGAAGQGHGHRQIAARRQGTGQLARLGGAAENQEMMAHDDF